VRQLENFMERLVVLSDGPKLTHKDVERELARDAARVRSAASEPRLEDQRREAERKAISDALQRASGNRSLAARLLGISRRTLYTKLAELGLLSRTRAEPFTLRGASTLEELCPRRGESAPRCSPLPLLCDVLVSRAGVAQL